MGGTSGLPSVGTPSGVYYQGATARLTCDGKTIETDLLPSGTIRPTQQWQVYNLPVEAHVALQGHLEIELRARPWLPSVRDGGGGAMPQSLGGRVFALVDVREFGSLHGPLLALFD
jgi:hypothetical protein